MTAMTEWIIPPSIHRWLSETPTDRPVVLLLRHSVRNPIPPGEAGNSLPITEAGITLCRELGATIAGRMQTLHTSPVLRCVQTAEVLREGAASEIPVVQDNLLGDPGIYVLDGKTAWSNWLSLGHEGVIKQLISSTDAMQGMARPDKAARFLVHHMLAIAEGKPGIHVFVTHDSLVAATASRLLGKSLGQEEWPWYLEGAFFWRDRQKTHVAYRKHKVTLPETQLCSFKENDIIEFARREIASTLGLDCPARFFLAGGAFKTLITGKPPNDLDIWAPSDQDREIILSTLMKRGAHRLPDRPFADAFKLNGRVIEVPNEVGPTTLKDRLSRFDIALSAVGVEYCPEDQWTVEVHPLAHASIQSGQVLLLKPLINWKYALVTLERMRRYAKEMGYSVPPEEEAEIWRVFDEQDLEMRRGMIQRYHRTATSSSSDVEDAMSMINRLRESTGTF